jgi:hypothetical protein
VVDLLGHRRISGRIEAALNPLPGMGHEEQEANWEAWGISGACARSRFEDCISNWKKVTTL